MPSCIKFFLTAIMGCLFLAGCTDHTSVEKAKALEAEIEQLRRLSSQAQIASKRLDAKIEAARQETERLKEENVKLQEALDAKSKEMEKFKKDFENYKLQYKVGMKTRLQGMHVADLSVDGTPYHHVTLMEMTETHLTISHDDGVRKIPLAQLPESLRDMLGLNIVVSSPDVVAEVDVKKGAAARKLEGDWAIVKATEQKSSICEQLGKARKNLEATKQSLDEAINYQKPVSALKRTIEDQEKAIVKLETQLIQVDIELYQARQERSRGMFAK